MFTKAKFRKYSLFYIFPLVVFITVQLFQLNFQKYAIKNHWDTWLEEGINFLSVFNTNYYWGILGFLLGCGFVSWIFKFIPESETRQPAIREANLILYFYEDSRHIEAKGSPNNIWRCITFIIGLHL